MMRHINYQVTVCYPDRKGNVEINKNDYDMIVQFDKEPKDIYGTVKEALIVKGVIRDNMHIISRIKKVELIGCINAGDPGDYITDEEHMEKAIDLTQELFGQD